MAARFLVDENVPESVTTFLRSRGHTVSLVREELTAGVPDPVVAKVAEEMQSIIVTWNVKDFRREVRRFGFGMLAFKCSEVDGRRRVEEEIEIIEFELQRCERDGRRFWGEVQRSGFKLHRTPAADDGDDP